MKYKIYVAGWYFEEYESFYQSMLPLKDHVIVGSHRKIPDNVSSIYKSKFYENIGGGIGLYEQLRLDDEFSEINEQDFVIFMHDDAKILRLDFPEKLFEILQTKKCAGNSIENPLYHDFKDIEAGEEYAKGDWFQKAKSIPDFKWKVVDGRCFAIKTEILREINGLEDMYWGTDHRTTNYSLRLFSAKLACYYGTESVDYISDKWLVSDYIIEDVGDNPNRSKNKGVSAFLSKIKKKIMSKIKKD
ncbi:hypothetical protein MHK_005824 [Candidatus Magnetomorum sp. HK-1]|nr:hypothetical protein MHK_005824 [Candidatus Magnetomorum sp. HK-1]